MWLSGYNKDPRGHGRYPLHLHRHFHCVHGRRVRQACSPVATDGGAQDGRARGVVGQVSGLVSLLLALVLGTLIGVSFAYYSTQKANLETFSAQILRLDQALAQYGPETKPMRDKIKAGIVKGYDLFWGGGDVDPNALTVEGPLANAQAISDYLATLKPQTDVQKAALATAALRQHGRAIAIADVPPGGERAGVLVPHRNSGVLDGGAVFRHRPLRRTQWAGLCRTGVRGLSIAFAIFLIFEFGLPYTGLFRVSPAALEQTIEFIDK